MAINNVLRAGKGCFQGIVDVETAFPNLKLHPDEWFYTGFRIGNLLFIDSRLPFGLRSSPWLWQRVEDALKWIANKRGITNIVDYVDDNHFTGTREKASIIAKLEEFGKLCLELGVPIKHAKTVWGLAVKFLGFIIDSDLMALYLSESDRERHLAKITTWLSREHASIKEIESLVGVLLHLARGYRGGGTHCRRLLFSLNGVRRKQGHRQVRLSDLFRADISWWHTALKIPRKISLTPLHRASALAVYTDASGGQGNGIGAFLSDERWFSIPWAEAGIVASDGGCIAVLEMYAIIAAAVAFGDQFQGKIVTVHTDNTQALALVEKRTSPNMMLIDLARRLHFLEIHFDFHMKAAYVKGEDNSLADALSRLNMKKFSLIRPNALCFKQIVPDWSILPRFKPSDTDLPMLFATDTVR